MIAWLPAILVALLLAANLLSFALTAWRCRPESRVPSPAETPPVSIIRPLAGLENHLEEMLRSNFELDYPDFELLLCVQLADDPVIAIAQRLIAAHPGVNARLLVGDDPFSANPKLNNCVKGWDAARHELVILADSNVLMPRDYVQQLLNGFGGRVAATFSPPIAARPESFWAEVECAFLNSFQARILYTADVLKLNPIQGKSMLLRRSFLEGAGGIRALTGELAEDVALRGLVFAAGARTRIVDAPFRQPLGHRTADEVLQRQRRWALLRRLAAPWLYPLELVLGGVMLMLFGGLAALALDADPWTAALGVGAINYTTELALAWRLGWLHSWRTPIAFLLRDVLLPGIWLRGIVDRGYSWRHFRIRAEGNVMRLSDEPL